MNWLRQLLFRLQPLFRRRQIERELDDELQAHVEFATEANLAAGMSPVEARRAALRELGHVESMKERYRDQRSLPWLEELLQDLRYGARQLRKAPGFALAAIATLAIGIGSTTAIFSMVHSITLRPLPYPESERLVSIRENLQPANISSAPTPGAF
ncbi:MAG: permease prefix domain 1-containing protein, partial [Verrucomicrobiota bacterium]